MELPELLDGVYRFTSAESHFAHIAAQDGGSRGGATRTGLAVAVRGHAARLMRRAELTIRIDVAHGPRKAELEAELAATLRADAEAVAAAEFANAVHVMMRAGRWAAPLPEPSVQACALTNRWVREIRADECLRNSPDARLRETAANGRAASVAWQQAELLERVTAQTLTAHHRHLALMDPDRAQEHHAVGRERWSTFRVQAQERLEPLRQHADAAKAAATQRLRETHPPATKPRGPAAELARRANGYARRRFSALCYEQNRGRRTSLWVRSLTSDATVAEVEKLLLWTMHEVVASEDLKRGARESSDPALVDVLRLRATVVDAHIAGRVHDFVVPFAVMHAFRRISEAAPRLRTEDVERLMDHVAGNIPSLQQTENEALSAVPMTREQIRLDTYQYMSPYRPNPLAVEDTESVFETISDARRNVGEDLLLAAADAHGLGGVFTRLPGPQVGLAQVDEAMRVAALGYGEWCRRGVHGEAVALAELALSPHPTHRRRHARPAMARSAASPASGTAPGPGLALFR